MNLLDLLKNTFDEATAENPVTFEGLKKVIEDNKCKFFDLQDGNYVDVGKLNDANALINQLNSAAADRENTLKQLNEQLNAAGNNSQELENVRASLNTLQNQYDTDKQNYENQLSQQRKTFAIKEYANSQKFTSSAAKRDFINFMNSKTLDIDDNYTIKGANDYRNEYQKSNEDAFVKENSSDNGGTTPPPQFVSTTPGTTPPPSGETNPFHFNFIGVRPHENKD